ncbi:ABC transporter permease, partial [Streptomyces sp. SID11233]|nr:ABC transporter permease [Streptomyces sp. SID11233]
MTQPASPAREDGAGTAAAPPEKSPETAPKSAPAKRLVRWDGRTLTLVGVLVALALVGAITKPDQFIAT